MCVHTKSKNVFVSEKDSGRPKRDDLTKLKMLADHLRATSLPKRQLGICDGSVAVNDNAKLAIIVQMRTGLTQAKHCLPTVKMRFSLTFKF